MAGIAFVIVAMAAGISAFRSVLYGHALANSVRKAGSAEPLLTRKTIWFAGYCCAFLICALGLSRMLGWNIF